MINESFLQMSLVVEKVHRIDDIGKKSSMMKTIEEDHLISIQNSTASCER